MPMKPLPNFASGFPVCQECAAVVVDEAIHLAWHVNMGRAAKAYVYPPVIT